MDTKELNKLTKAQVVEQLKSFNVDVNESLSKTALIDQLAQFYSEQSSEEENINDQPSDLEQSSSEDYEAEEQISDELSDEEQSSEEENINDQPSAEETMAFLQSTPFNQAFKLEIAKRQARNQTGIAHVESSTDALASELAKRKSRFGVSASSTADVSSALKQELARRNVKHN